MPSGPTEVSLTNMKLRGIMILSGGRYSVLRTWGERHCHPIPNRDDGGDLLHVMPNMKACDVITLRVACGGHPPARSLLGAVMSTS